MPVWHRWGTKSKQSSCNNQLPWPKPHSLRYTHSSRRVLKTCRKMPKWHKWRQRRMHTEPTVQSSWHLQRVPSCSSSSVSPPSDTKLSLLTVRRPGSDSVPTTRLVSGTANLALCRTAGCCHLANLMPWCHSRRPSRWQLWPFSRTLATNKHPARGGSSLLNGLSLGWLCVAQGPKFGTPLHRSFLSQPTEYTCQASSTSAQRSGSLRVSTMLTLNRWTDKQTFDQLSQERDD